MNGAPDLAGSPHRRPWRLLHDGTRLQWGQQAGPGQPVGPARDRFVRTANVPRALPASDQDIAYAPLSQLSRWVETRQLTS